MTSEQPQASKKPIFFSLSSVMFAASLLLQLYFFLVLNDVLSKKENAMDILESILESLLLLAPILSLATISMGLSLLSAIISWLRKEPLKNWLLSIIGTAFLDIVVFVCILAFGYE